MAYSLPGPLPMGFSRQEYWSGLPFPLSGDLPDPGIKHASLCFLCWQVDSLLLSHLGKPTYTSATSYFVQVSSYGSVRINFVS